MGVDRRDQLNPSEGGSDLHTGHELLGNGRDKKCHFAKQQYKVQFKNFRTANFKDELPRSNDEDG
jgi:hypothetical protein